MRRLPGVPDRAETEPGGWFEFMTSDLEPQLPRGHPPFWRLFRA